MYIKHVIMYIKPVIMYIKPVIQQSSTYLIVEKEVGFTVSGDINRHKSPFFWSEIASGC